jgi:hypothetical protein
VSEVTKAGEGRFTEDKGVVARELTTHKVLGFVQQRANLLQIHNRQPGKNFIRGLYNFMGIDDGYFPRIKHFSEYEKQDIEPLITDE